MITKEIAEKLRAVRTARKMKAPTLLEDEAVLADWAEETGLLGLAKAIRDGRPCRAIEQLLSLMNPEYFKLELDDVVMVTHGPETNYMGRIIQIFEGEEVRLDFFNLPSAIIHSEILRKVGQ